jgi:type I restriction enzyme S subunit
MTDMKNWEKKKLGEVCVVERGSSPRPIEKYQTDSPDGVNWIKIGDTKGVDKYIFSTKEKITKEGAEKSRYVKEGDFILSNSMSFGKPYIMKTDGYIHDGWFVFRLPNFLDKDYFYYLLTSPNVQEQIQSLGAGAIVKNISGDLVKKVDITYPKSLPEQQRIVAILDEAFAAIAKAKANAEQNLKNAKELYESYLQGVFENPARSATGAGDGWEEKKLIEITNKIGSGATPRGGNESYKTEGISLIRSMNVHDFEFRERNLAFIDEQQAKELNNVTLQENDVLLNITGASVARCCVIPKEYLPARVNQHVSIIRAKKEIIDPIFLNLLLTSKFYKDQLLFTGEQGATRQAITKAQLEVFEVAFPKSLIAQQAIVQKLDALSTETKKLEAIYQQKINDLEELKKSILQKAFSGEL